MTLSLFNKVVWFVLASMLEGILLPSNMTAKTTFCLYLVKRLIVTFRCAVNVTTSFFSTFSLQFKCKICVQKEVISHFGHELTHFKKMIQVWKTKSLLFCLRYDPLSVFWRQNHITFIFIKTMSHDPLVQMAYWKIFPKSRLNIFFIVFKMRDINHSIWIKEKVLLVLNSNTVADPGFCLGGVALVSCSTSTPINQIVFFLQNNSCSRKPQVISGRGGGAHPLHPPPRSAAVTMVI